MSKTVSLVLGSGGARGLTHIGVIEELEKRGYQIKAISGSSIGACVGAMYAAGKLKPFKKWAKSLTRMSLFRLLDFTFSTQGVVKGKRILEELERLVGNCNIEDLPIPFTAVATDMHTGQEVWINRGSLFDAMRASASIPTFFTPLEIHGRSLIDGGVTNPTPIEPILQEKNDLIIVVNINARKTATLPTQVTEEMEHFENEESLNSFTQQKWLQSLPIINATKEAMTVFGIINKSTEIMMEKLTDFSIYHYQPDIVINIPQDTCTTFEFDRATELIKLGRAKCKKALNRYEINNSKRTDFSSVASVLLEYLPLRFGK